MADGEPVAVGESCGLGGRCREEASIETEEHTPAAKRPRHEKSEATPATKLRGFEFYRSLGSPKYVCAPMVDQSELAFRMLTRRYGCQLAYTPMMHSRLFNEQPKYRKQNFTTCPEEKGSLVVQFCGDDPATMAAAAKHCEKECDAVDINFGCPQGIARKGHYGSFLLEEGDLCASIVRRMDEELSVPVFCKMRLLKPRAESLQETMNFCYGLQAAGCSLLTVHGRTKEMKGQSVGLADWEAVKIIKSRLDIPVFVNGGIETFDDVQRCLKETGCDGVMSSESLLENPALFSGKVVSQDQLATEYLELAKIYDAPKSAVKAHLFRFLYAGMQFNIDIRAQLGAAKNHEEMLAAALALKQRRSEQLAARGGVEDPLRPDKGWYLRYRKPLGDRAAEGASRAERKAAAAAPAPAPAAATADPAQAVTADAPSSTSA